MLIYNISTKIETGIEIAWIKWMEEEHIPAVIEAGSFEKYQLVKLLDIDDTDGPTYAVQFFINDKNKYDAYIQNHSSRLRKEALQKWSDRIISFRSLMQVISSS